MKITEATYRAVMICTIVLTACSTAPRQQPGVQEIHTDLNSQAKDSAVDITYVLGHNKHRFTVQGTAAKIIGQTYLDRQIVDEGAIEDSRYVDFLAKVQHFVASGRRVPANDPQCRAPFTVTMRLGTNTQVLHGCRSSDEGALSRLVRDGEFLLYSKR